MKSSILLFLFFSILSAAPSCNCKNNGCTKNYRFQIPISLSPQIDTFKIGDTIWVNCDFSKEILDVNSGDYNNLESFNFKSNISIKDISIEPFQDANLNFEISNKIGSLDLIQLVGTTTLKIDYNFDSERFKLKVGLIPQKKGMFLFIPYSLIPNNFNDFEINPDCVEEIEHIDYLLNGGIDNNYEFIQLSPDSTTRTITKKVFDLNGNYCLYVEE